MTIHMCPRCGYNTKHTSGMKTHLNRKFICKPEKEDISLDEFKKIYLKEILYTCTCAKCFISKTDYTQHISMCASYIQTQKTSASDLVLKEVLVDPEDLELINKYTWAKTNAGYIRGEVDGKPIFMHQLLLGKAPENMIIDHKNGIKHDNRRMNLRFANNNQNGQNRESLKDSSSKYLGVSWETGTKKWIAQSHLDGKNIRLGGFTDETEAAKRYDTFVLLHFGEHARINELINYKDIKDLDLEEFLDKKKRDVPKFIKKKITSYEVTIIYKGKKFNKTVSTLELAEEILLGFQNEIQKIKDAEIKIHYAREIMRNEKGIAIVPVKNDKGEIIDYFMVDDDCWHDVMRYPWCQQNKGYFQSRINGKLCMIHHYIYGKIVPKGKLIDHWDKNSWNNRSKNLRLSDFSGNGHNKTKKVNSTSKYYGVILVNKKDKKYRANVKKNGTTYNLGTFADEKEAALAYNIKATELYGEFANLNIL